MLPVMLALPLTVVAPLAIAEALEIDDAPGRHLRAGSS
jgi:hypothetical protein